MLDLINEAVAYWHWIVLGLLLISFELLVPTFITLWMGIAAILVGILMSMVGISINAQLLIWIGLSIIFILLWHRYISPKIQDKTTAGLSREAMVGQQGLVIRYDEQHGRGHLRFPAPILGNDEWEFICDSPLASGDKVQVVDISGNHVVVKPH